MGFTIKFENKIPALMKRLDKLNGMEVEVGFFEEDRYGPENHNLPVATVAAYNEFGTRYNPRRPFMSDTFEDNMSQLFMARGMADVFTQVLKGGRDTPLIDTGKMLESVKFQINQ